MNTWREQESYLRHPDECPLCGSTDTEGDSVTTGILAENGSYRHAEQEMSCQHCGAEWMDTYSLIGYTPVIREPDYGDIAFQLVKTLKRIETRTGGSHALEDAIDLAEQLKQHIGVQS